MRPAIPARLEHQISPLEIIRDALRAAAIAPTVYDALDLTGAALAASPILQKRRCVMHKHTEHAKRAAVELAAAHQALQRAHALFAVIEFAIAGGAIDTLGARDLASLGADVTGQHGERAESEAGYFRGLASSQENSHE